MSKGRRVEYKDGMIVQSNREGACIVQSKQRHCCVGAKETHHKRGRRRKQEEEGGGGGSYADNTYRTIKLRAK